MRTRILWTIVATIGLAAGVDDRASASDVSPLSSETMVPVLDAGYSLTPTPEPPLGQRIIFNEGAPHAVPGGAYQGGQVQAFVPEGVAESCSACNAGPSTGVFDSCHLGNAGGGDDCCCDGCPTWSLRAGVVILQRQTDRPGALVTNIAATPTDLLDASQFAYPMRGGPDIDLIHHGCYVDIEARYFAVDEFAASVGPTATGGPAVIQFATPVAAAADSVSASEYSQLRSIEVNLRKEVIPCWLTVLAGYRHIELNERILGSTSVTGVTTDLFSTQGFNRMDGFQLGGEAILWRPCCGSRFRVEGDAKVGLFNDASSNYGAIGVPGGATAVATATGSHTAFMAEWGITGVLQITPHLAGRAGYQGLLLDGVALASQQIGALDPLTGAATTVNTGTPIYHGAVVDLEYCW